MTGNHTDVFPSTDAEAQRLELQGSNLYGGVSILDGQGINAPLPCRYGIARANGRRMDVLHRLNPWRHDTVWTCLGLHLLDVLRDFAHPRSPIELERCRLLVERLGCFPEILEPEGAERFKGALVMSEDSMLWAASLWSLLKSAASDSNRHSERASAPGQAPPKAGL